MVVGYVSVPNTNPASILDEVVTRLEKSSRILAVSA